MARHMTKNQDFVNLAVTPGSGFYGRYALPKILGSGLIWLSALVVLSLAGPRTAWAQANDTAYGTAALESNSTGSEDSAFGVDALRSNNTGWGNTAIGFDEIGRASCRERV